MKTQFQQLGKFGCYQYHDFFQHRMGNDYCRI